MTSPTPLKVSASSLGALAALGFASALWAGFLWSELLVARSGGTPFCGLEAGGCTALWDGAFASAVHHWSGVPVAGFGLLWGVAAGLLPLLALVRAAEGRDAADAVCAVRVTAGVGVVAVFALLAVLAGERAFCSGCFLSYVLTAGYAGIALFGWQRLGLSLTGRGAAMAAATLALGYAALLYPGRHTPAAGAGRKAVEAAAPASAGDAEVASVLKQVIASLPPQALQTLSDSLYVYRNATPTELQPPRALFGAATAPVRVTEWTDVLCDHCAELGLVLEAIRERVPEGSFSVDPRQFPLDGRCNPTLQRASAGEDVRCLAARARICLEGDASAEAVGRALFAAQKELTPRKVLEIAGADGRRKALEACLASPETERKLQQDIAAAARFGIDGTPLVLINGRRGTSFGPFLYAMILTGGDAQHSAFASLPPPNPNAHLH
jgi:serine/threonine-protein kinase